MPGEHHQVVGDDGGPDVGMKAFLTPPVAAVQAEDGVPALLGQDVGVGLENADDLLPGDQLSAQQHPLPGLFDDLLHEFQPAHDLVPEYLPVFTQTPDDVQHLLVKILTLIEQLAVEAFPLPGVFGLGDPESQSLGHPAAVAAAQRLGQVGLPDGAADDPDQIIEQGGIAGAMDVGLHRGAVKAHLAAGLDALFFGPAHQHPVDGLPGTGGQAGDIVLQGTGAGPHIKGAKSKKETAGYAVEKVEGQPIIGYSHQLEQHRRLDHGHGLHARRPSFWVSVPYKVLPGQLCYDRMCVKNPCHDRKLPREGMVGPGFVQLGLNLQFLAHCGPVLFSVIVVLSVSYAKTTLTQKRQKPQTVLRQMLISFN